VLYTFRRRRPGPQSNGNNQTNRVLLIQIPPAPLNSTSTTITAAASTSCIASALVQLAMVAAADVPEAQQVAAAEYMSVDAWMQSDMMEEQRSCVGMSTAFGRLVLGRQWE
jgi:hypothetical protein